MVVTMHHRPQRLQAHLLVYNNKNVLLILVLFIVSNVVTLQENLNLQGTSIAGCVRSRPHFVYRSRRMPQLFSEVFHV